MVQIHPLLSCIFVISFDTLENGRELCSDGKLGPTDLRVNLPAVLIPPFPFNPISLLQYDPAIQDPCKPFQNVPHARHYNPDIAGNRPYA